MLNIVTASYGLQGMSKQNRINMKKLIHQVSIYKIPVIVISLIFVLLVFSCLKDKHKPNFLFIITDDQSWEHLACYGDKAIRTPIVDSLANEGVRFENAYTPCPSCSPSRAAILTGQDIYRLKEGGVLTGFIREEFAVFPELLKENGYVIGYTGKGYWPFTKDAEGAINAPFGKNFSKHHYDKVPHGISKRIYSANFEQFLDDNTAGSPFFFWIGIGEPHRPYEIDRGIQTGIDTAKIRIPEFFPDVPATKLDMADYMSEIEWADKAVGEILEVLELKGLKENTVIIFTSDNGMPFPRSKATLYDHGVRMPLIISWENHIKGMRVVKDPVNLIDLTPTILELAEIDIPEQMTGKSISNLLFSNKSGSIDKDREFVVTAFEKHTHCRPEELGFPRRAIHTEEWTYIINYEPDRYPMGDFDVFIPNWDNLGETDPGRLKDYYKRNVNNIEFTYFYDLAFGKVKSEQLYNKSDDPDMINNLASNQEYQEIKNELRKNLESYLVETNDPRLKGLSPWDEYKLDK